MTDHSSRRVFPVSRCHSSTPPDSLSSLACRGWEIPLLLRLLRFIEDKTVQNDFSPEDSVPVLEAGHPRRRTGAGSAAVSCGPAPAITTVHRPRNSEGPDPIPDGLWHGRGEIHRRADARRPRKPCCRTERASAARPITCEGPAAPQRPASSAAERTARPGGVPARAGVRNYTKVVEQRWQPA